MTRTDRVRRYGRSRASSTTSSSPRATPNGRTQPTRTSPATRATTSTLAIAYGTALTRSSPRQPCSSTPLTDYPPHSFASWHVRARAQHESSSTRSTDLPVALAPPADVNKHGSS